MALISCLALVPSCETLDFAGFVLMVDTNVNDRFDSSMEYLESNPFEDVNVSSNDYGLYLVTDIHCDGSNDRLERFVSACISDTESEKVVLCLGDIVNGRDYQKDIFGKLSPLADNGWRFINVLGNHDTYFRQFSKFQEFWPLTTFSFRVNTPGEGSDLFLGLDSADGTFGTSQRKWLEERLKEAKGNYRNIYVMTHTNFFNTDNTQLTSGNYSFEESFDLMALFAKYGVNYVLTGHDHYYEYRRFRGVDYYTFNALCNDTGSYYKMSFGKELRFSEISIE
ncbi:MAG: metallophosphoesterase [Bacteroidales bacterium]|nr:metallophosphoesterase [Bacteroidales bacterium]